MHDRYGCADEVKERMCREERGDSGKRYSKTLRLSFFTGTLTFVASFVFNNYTGYRIIVTTLDPHKFSPTVTDIKGAIALFQGIW